MKILLSAALFVLAATPAMAEPDVPTSSVVRVADLSLANSADKRAFDRRIARAVAEVCGTASDADLVGQNQVRDCRLATRAHVSDLIETRLAGAASGPISLATR